MIKTRRVRGIGRRTKGHLGLRRQRLDRPYAHPRDHPGCCLKLPGCCPGSAFECLTTSPHDVGVAQVPSPRFALAFPRDDDRRPVREGGNHGSQEITHTAAPSPPQAVGKSAQVRTCCAHGYGRGRGRDRIARPSNVVRFRGPLAALRPVLWVERARAVPPTSTREPLSPGTTWTSPTASSPAALRPAALRRSQRWRYDPPIETNPLPRQRQG